MIEEQETTEVESAPQENSVMDITRKVLEQENQLRLERDKFKSEQTEWKDQLERFNSAKEKAKLDPVSFLDSLGLSNEDKVELAKLVFFETHPDLADEDTKFSLQEMRLKRLEKRLESTVKEKPKEKEVNTDYYTSYVNDINHEINGANFKDYPSIDHYLSKNSFTKENLSAQIVELALKHAEKLQGKGDPLGIDKALQTIEESLKEHLGKENKESEEEQVTLTNSVNSTQETQHKTKDVLSDDEIARRKQKAVKMLERYLSK